MLELKSIQKSKMIIKKKKKKKTAYKIKEVSNKYEVFNKTKLIYLRKFDSISKDEY